MSTRQYIGARYVPVFADPVEWDIDNSYEHLMMVQHLGDTYISQQAVPPGIYLPDIEHGIESNDYWVHMSNWNAQIETYREEVLAFSGRISDVETGLENVEKDVKNEFMKYNRVGKFVFKNDEHVNDFIIAHQGFDKVYPGNTVDSYTYAATHFADAIECDLYFTYDDIPVCAHNNDLSTFTTGSGTITTSTYSYLQSIEINTGANISVTQYPYIPTFESFIQICAKYGKVAVIDIKSHSWTDTQKKLIFDILDRYGMRYNCVFISALLNELVNLREYDDSLCLMFIQLASSSPITADMYDTMVENAIDIDADVNTSLLTSAFVNEVRSHGIYLAVWTISSLATNTHANTFNISMKTMDAPVYFDDMDSYDIMEASAKFNEPSGNRFVEYMKTKGVFFGNCADPYDQSSMIKILNRSISKPVTITTDAPTLYKITFNPFVKKIDSSTKIAIVGFNLYQDTVYKLDYTGYIQNDISENEEMNFFIPIPNGTTMICLYVVETSNILQYDYLNCDIKLQPSEEMLMRAWGTSAMPSLTNDTTFIVNRPIPGYSNGQTIALGSSHHANSIMKAGTYSVSKTTGLRVSDGVSFTTMDTDKFYTLPTASQNISDIAAHYVFIRVNTLSDATNSVRTGNVNVLKDFVAIATLVGNNIH